MENLEVIKKFFIDYTNNFSPIGITFLVVDILLVIGILYFIYKILKIKLRVKKLLVFILCIALTYGVTYLLDFKIAFNMLKVIAFWSVGVLVIIYNQEIKHAIESGLSNNASGSVYSSDEEKMSVVNAIVEAASYLSERRIGALVSIERNDNLDSFINKAIYIKGNITEELLTSLFFVGSATHDGAVIVRKNFIMCAGAYLPSTDRYDVPKSLGTRHRAAIGLSEKYDAITVVVSEETGMVSVTVDGVIQMDLSKDRLREILSQYLLSK